MKYSNNVITCSKSSKERIKDEAILKRIKKLEEKLKKIVLGKEKDDTRKSKMKRKHRNKKKRSKKSKNERGRKVKKNIV